MKEEDLVKDYMKIKEKAKNELVSSVRLEKKESTEKEVKFLEKIVKVNFLVNFILVFVILVGVIGVIFYKDSLFGEEKADGHQILQLAENANAELAKEQDFPVLFINEQGVDVQKAFESTSGGQVKFTSKGSLSKEVFGYLPYWAVPQADKINIDYLTSVAYFGLEVDANGEIIKNDLGGKNYVPWTMFNDTHFDEFVKRAKANKTKVYVTLKCFDQLNIIRLTTSEQARKNFISNALYLVESKGLDGINVDFEYIGTPKKEVRDGFSVLMADLNDELKRNYPESHLSIATFVDAGTNYRIHDVEFLAKHADSLVIMGYDFHTPNSSQAGPVAPMEGYGYSITSLMNGYFEKSPPEKLILAVAYYGYDWPVASGVRNNQVIGGRPNVRTYPYATIADMSAKLQINWDQSSKTPWFLYVDPISRQTRVVHFENTRSLGIKYDFVNDKKMQGVGIWALGYEGNRTDLTRLLSDKFSK